MHQGAADCAVTNRTGRMTDMKVRLSTEQRALVCTVRDLARSKFRSRALKYMVMSDFDEVDGFIAMGTF
jgi:hypothetical protein